MRGGMLELFDEENEVVYDIEATTQTLILNNDEMGKIMSNKDYHNSGRVGSTMLGILQDNALKYKMIIDKTIKFESEAFDMGSVLHCIILEPEECDNVFIVEDLEISRVVKKIVKDDLDFIAIPEEFLTPSGAISKKKDIYEEYEEFKYANRDKLLVNRKDIEMIEYLKSTEHLIRITTDKKESLDIAIENVKQLQGFEDLIKDGYTERAFFATIDGVECQCKPDLYYIPDKDKPNEIVIIDFKTSMKEATNEEFLKSSANFNYYGQEALYTRVMEENGFTVKAFFFAYTSRLIYGGSSFQEHTEADKELGRTYLSKALVKYKYCRDNDLYLVNNFNGTDFDFVGRGALPAFVHFKYNN